ncbi:hypothetical protein FACS1894208_10560 [Clostridia bacterium]|nr:hypothetical protein FACS1894208_10560 [Clostridia bacterium]
MDEKQAWIYLPTVKLSINELMEITEKNLNYLEALENWKSIGAETGVMFIAKEKFDHLLERDVTNSSGGGAVC